MRQVFSVCMAIVGVWGAAQGRPSLALKSAWLASTWSMALFPLLPAAVGGITWLVYAFHLPPSPPPFPSSFSFSFSFSTFCHLSAPPPHCLLLVH